MRKSAGQEYMQSCLAMDAVRMRIILLRPERMDLVRLWL